MRRLIEELLLLCIADDGPERPNSELKESLSELAMQWIAPPSVDQRESDWVSVNLVPQ